MPKRGIHLKLQEWAREYGPIYSLMLGTQVTIMVNNAEVAKELLERRSAIWSSRPELYMAMTVMGSGLRFNLMVSQAVFHWTCASPRYLGHLAIDKCHSRTGTSGA